jgi:hypothetical protein
MVFAIVEQLSLIFVWKFFAAFLVEKGFLGIVQDCSFWPVRFLWEWFHG